MTQESVARVPLASRDVAAERAEQLRALVSEAFADGRPDAERLQQWPGRTITGRRQQLKGLDAAFAGDEQLKTNIRLEAESHGVRFQTI